MNNINNNTDEPNESPFWRSVCSLKRQLEDIENVLLAVRIGDFYEFFGDDAVEVSRILGVTLTKRNGNQMAGVPYHEPQFNKLAHAGRSIAVAELVQNVATGRANREIVAFQIKFTSTLINVEPPSRLPTLVAAPAGDAMKIVLGQLGHICGIEARRRRIEEILDRGNTVVFRNLLMPSVVKKVKKWELNDVGDLIAEVSTGKCGFVAWESDQYAIEEERVETNGLN